MGRRFAMISRMRSRDPVWREIAKLEALQRMTARAEARSALWTEKHFAKSPIAKFRRIAAKLRRDRLAEARRSKR